MRRVVLVTLDGARPGAEQSAAMPALRALAASGIAFTAAQTPSLRTFPATVALFTGQAPEKSGVLDEWSKGAPASGPTLAATLGEAGIRTLGLPADALLHAGTGIGRGFTRYDTRAPSYPESARVDSALAWLGGAGRRMVWIELDFGSPKEPWRRDNALPWPDAAAYDRRAVQVDEAIARLMRGLAKWPANGVAVVVAGTHGAALGSEPDWGASAAAYSVPLVVRAPGLRAATTEPVSLLDLPRTVLDIAGVRSKDFPGSSLFGPRAPRATIAARAAVAAEPCRAALHEWFANLPARIDSAAIVRAQVVSEKCPNLAVPAIEAAVALSIGGRETIAAQRFLDLRKRFPDDPRVLLASADHLLRYKRFDMVGTTVTGIPRESPLAAEAAWREALAATGMLDFATARATIERASAMAVPVTWRDAEQQVARLAAAQAASDRDPRDIDAHIALGRALGDFGITDESFSHLNIARLIDTTRVEADVWIAFYLERIGRAPHAIKALERAVAHDSSHHGARLALAEALAGGDRWKEAIPHFVRALELEPADGRTHYNLACLLARSGESDRAMASLERAVTAGYRDWDQIAADPDLESLRSRPEFAKLRSVRSR